MEILDDSVNNYLSAIKARSVRIAVTQQTGSGAIVQDLVFALLNAKKNFHVVIVGHANLHTHVSLWICLICWFHQRQERCSKHVLLLWVLPAVSLFVTIPVLCHPFDISPVRLHVPTLPGSISGGVHVHATRFASSLHAPRFPTRRTSRGQLLLYLPIETHLPLFDKA